MICIPEYTPALEGPELCAGVSGTLGPVETLPIQLKSVSRNFETRFANIAFTLDGAIRATYNTTLAVGRGARLTSVQNRTVYWNLTDLGQLRSGNDCLTAMECDKGNKFEPSTYCNPDSIYPIREPKDFRRGVYVKLYPCTFRLYGQRWMIVNATFDTESPSTEYESTRPPSLRQPSVSPSASPSAHPSTLPSADNLTSLNPTAFPTVSPTVTPTDSPSSFSPSYFPTTIVVSPSRSPSAQNVTNNALNAQAPPYYAIGIALALLLLLILAVVYRKTICRHVRKTGST